MPTPPTVKFDGLRATITVHYKGQPGDYVSRVTLLDPENARANYFVGTLLERSGNEGEAVVTRITNITATTFDIYLYEQPEFGVTNAPAAASDKRRRAAG